MSGATNARSRGFLILALVAAGAAFPQHSSAQALRSEPCTECHLNLSDERLAAPARTFPGDIHAQRGFDCLACHGGGAGRQAAAGFLSRPARREIPELCGHCHSNAEYMRQFNPSMRVDQVAEYVTSGHGMRLLQRNDPDVATCTDCHRVHEIRPPSDPQSSVFARNVAATCGGCHADSTRMAGHGIPTDQLEEYRSSVHGRLMFEEEDLSAPTCNDCHGNHGATPPGIASIRNVCGQCHATMADFFTQSRHVDIFEREGLPGCETCHGNHEIQPATEALLPERTADVCGRCHQPGGRLGGEFNAIARLIDSLETSFDSSRAVLEAAANAGMEVSQAQFELEDVNNALTMARSAVHAFHVEPVAANVDEGLEVTRVAMSRGQAALEEHTFRRVGLAFSSAIILLLIIGLLLKIRQLEQRRTLQELTDRQGGGNAHG